jgi:hypothetical protein
MSIITNGRLYNWTKHDEKTYTAEASELGIKPGDRPGTMSLPGGMCALRHQWDAKTSPEGEILCWEIRHSHGVVFTIFND